jgi:predicted dehydrogenase
MDADKSNRSNRRTFLKQSAAGVAAAAMTGTVPATVLGANDRIRIGVIGCGGRGNALMDLVLQYSEEQNVEIGALCDVWSVNLENTRDRLAAAQDTAPETFSRYEDLLDLDDIDAVIIATPDFAHSPILADAARAGVDAYVEKPMACRMIYANQARKLVKQNNTVVQVGTQFRSEPRHRAAANVLRQGMLGHVSEVETAYHDNSARWKRDYSDVRERDVDWQQFLMYLPDEPFDPARFRQWQLFKDFTVGTVGLLGAHRIDVAHWFMGDPLPKSAVANGGVYVWKDAREHADTLDAVIEYPSGCILEYSTRLGNNYPVPNVRMYGTKGTFDTSSWKIRGEGGGEGALEEATTIPPKEGNMGEEHMRNWLECLRTRETPHASIDVGYAHSVAGILTFRALETGNKYMFDPETKKVRPA